MTTTSRYRSFEKALYHLTICIPLVLFLRGEIEQVVWSRTFCPVCSLSHDSTRSIFRSSLTVAISVEWEHAWDVTFSRIGISSSHRREGMFFASLRSIMTAAASLA